MEIQEINNVNKSLNGIMFNPKINNINTQKEVNKC